MNPDYFIYTAVLCGLLGIFHFYKKQYNWAILMLICYIINLISYFGGK